MFVKLGWKLKGKFYDSKIYSYKGGIDSKIIPTAGTVFQGELTQTHIYFNR